MGIGCRPELPQSRDTRERGLTDHPYNGVSLVDPSRPELDTRDADHNLNQATIHGVWMRRASGIKESGKHLHRVDPEVATPLTFADGKTRCYCG